ncbi:MAG: HAD family hydrolase [Planctomycetota bacterium]
MPRRSTPERPEGILFDLDDTLISFSASSEPAWAEACREAKEKHGELRPLALREIIRDRATWFWSDPERHRIGRADMEQARREIVRGALKGAGFLDTEVADEIAGSFSRKRNAAIELFPRVREMLFRLCKEGLILGLVTNGGEASQRWKIDKFGLGGFFDAVFIEGALGFGKPQEKVYALALETLGLDAPSTWMVGDNLVWDVEAPQRLGITGIWHDVYKKGLPPDSDVKPDFIISEPWEIIGLLGLA